MEICLKHDFPNQFIDIKNYLKIYKNIEYFIK